MKSETKKKVKKVGYVLGGGVLVIAAGTAAYVFGHTPDYVDNPCFRSCHRANGCPKKPFDKAWKANWQSVKQFILHGEICNSYQVDNRFYTGHSKNAFCKNINPFK